MGAGDSAAFAYDAATRPTGLTKGELSFAQAHDRAGKSDNPFVVVSDLPQNVFQRMLAHGTARVEMYRGPALRLRSVLQATVCSTSGLGAIGSMKYVVESEQAVHER
jgi:hypothetical protein